MDFTDKLDLLMKERGINKADLSRLSGVPYTTITSFYDKGSDNVKLSTLKKLASYFSVTLDFLVDDTATDTDKVINFTKENIREEILTKAAHSVGHDEPLTNEEISKIELAIKIALAKNNK